MKYVIRIWVMVLVGILFGPVLSANGQNGPDWSGKLKDGTKITQGELNRVLQEHRAWTDITWVETNKKEGQRAQFQGADLSGADLGKADISEAALIGANLRDVDMTNAIPTGADLDSAIFELKAGSLPNIAAISSAKNLSKLKYVDSPHALVELREAFKSAGLLTQEREITHAVKNSQRKALWEKGLWRKLESLFNLIFFELTCW